MYYGIVAQVMLESIKIYATKVQSMNAIGYLWEWIDNEHSLGILALNFHSRKPWIRASPLHSTK